MSHVEAFTPASYEEEESSTVRQWQLGGTIVAIDAGTYTPQYWVRLDQFGLWSIVNRLHLPLCVAVIPGTALNELQG